MLNIAKTDSGKEVIAPTVHLNGTGKDSLIEMFMGVRMALVAAEKAISESHPHWRDYYIQNGPEEPLYGEPTYRAAMEHRARLLKLNEIEEEINAIIFNIQDQRG